MASKAELAAAQQLSEKAELTKADLELSIGRLQSAIESVYTEMKRAGHSGLVTYMLDESGQSTSNLVVGPKTLPIIGSGGFRDVEYVFDPSIHTVSKDEFDFQKLH